MKKIQAQNISQLEREETRTNVQLQIQKICLSFEKQICSHPDLISSPSKGMYDLFCSCLSPQDHCTGMHSGLLEEFEYTICTSL